MPKHQQPGDAMGAAADEHPCSSEPSPPRRDWTAESREATEMLIWTATVERARQETLTPRLAVRDLMPWDPRLGSQAWGRTRAATRFRLR